MKDIKVGDVIEARFVMIVRSIVANDYKDGEVNLGGLITSGGKNICMTMVPSEYCEKVEERNDVQDTV